MSQTQHSLALILVAGGNGSRLGGTPKQFRFLHGKPVWLWSIDRLYDLFDEIIIVANEEYHSEIKQRLVDHPAQKAENPFAYQVVSGGASRQESVDNGIKSSTADIILVHDAARPFINPADVQEVIATLTTKQAPAAILADRCAATVKTINTTTQTITGTVPREELALAATPQGFARSILEKFSPTVVTTDEASRCEAVGIPVTVVWAEHPNPKITLPADWEIAQALADRQVAE